MKRTMIGVIGASEGSKKDHDIAYGIGKLAAENGWIVVCGGLGGVMEAASRGASDAGGTVVGILPQDSTRYANMFVTVPIATNMGHARNIIIAHTADALVAIGGGEGTLSEIAIARKLGKPVFSVGSWDVAGVVPARDAKDAFERCKESL